MKKLISVVLCAVLMLGLLPVFSSPASAGARVPTYVNVSVNDQSIRVGDWLTWTINVNPPGGNYQTRLIIRNDGVEYIWGSFTDSNIHTYRILKAGTATAEAIGLDLSDGLTTSVISAETKVTLRPGPAISGIETLSGSSVRVSWNPIEGASGYYLWRSNAPAGPYVLRRTTTALSASDTYLTPGTKYYFKVSAYIQSGATKYDMTEQGGFKVAVPLGKATISSVKTDGSARLKVTWAVVPGAQRYIVYRSTSANGSYRKLGTTAALSYINTGLTKGKNYYYKVKPYINIGAVYYYGILSGYKMARAR